MTLGLTAAERGLVEGAQGPAAAMAARIVAGGRLKIVPAGTISAAP